MTLGEPFYMHFINQGFVPGDIRGRVGTPGKSGVDDAIFRHSRGVVAPIKRQVFLLVPDPISKVCVVPLNSSLDLLAVGIEKKFVGIKTMALLR